MEIRQPRPDEHDRITDELLWPSYEDAGEDDPFNELADDAYEEAADPTNWTDGDDTVIFVAVRDDELCGYVSGFLSASGPLYARGPTAYCDGLYVRDSARREGIATALFERFEEWGREMDCDHLGVAVHVDNEPARAFYDSLGFQPKFVSPRKKL
ncbi:GNAT family N-acetyltransferase [Haloarchaeobius litoreus]|uniref:GNAT family N-acetyltransferase n=1 Tax=Haloarchaeobius litoreus TaxID=755306 RepID=A0ABD6DMB4_9EURY|nr:GNAT family N-acetyltransferase [Haloarchaeobius litoreus]